jgi:hypothetical protein
MKWVCLLALLGCSPLMRDTGAGYPASQAGAARVFFYRGVSFSGAAVAIKIYDNGELIGAVRNGSYFVHAAAAGAHVFTLKKAGGQGRALELEAGGSYCLSVDAERGIFTARDSLRVEDTAQCEAAIAPLRHLRRR